MYGVGKGPEVLISLRSAKGEYGESCMTLERITEKNIDYAIQIQEELFPGESGRSTKDMPIPTRQKIRFYHKM